MLEGWKSVALSELATFHSGGTPNKEQSSFWGGPIPWVTVKDMKAMRLNGVGESLTEEGANTVRVVPAGTVLVLVRGMGLFKDLPVVLCDRPVTFNQDIKALVAKEDVDSEYLAFALIARKSDILRHVDSAGHGTGRLDTDLLKSTPLPLPPISEQRKIAEILRTWDEAIEKLEALRAAKLRGITAMRQHLFEAAYACPNRLQRAKDIFETVSERARPDLPLLAVMQDIGIVRRDELDRRVVMPDGNTSSYKVVRPGDFVISLRSFEGGLEYSAITGLVSPAYTVLRPTTELVGDYYRHFFKSRSFIGRLDKLIFGIRDGKQIAFRDFGDMYIPAPPLAEQEAQARVFNCQEAGLALENERIVALTRQKRGLMQKLLTGEWRVNTEKAFA